MISEVGLDANGKKFLCLEGADASGKVGFIGDNCRLIDLAEEEIAQYMATYGLAGARHDS